MRKIFVAVLAMCLLLGMMTTAMAGCPSFCPRCGQDKVFGVSCGSFAEHRFAICPLSESCIRLTSYHYTKYTCMECLWSVESGTHQHQDVHSLHNSPMLCPFD